MDIKDLPAIIDTFFDQEKLDRINFIVEAVNQGFMSQELADIEIEKIIREEIKSQ